MNLDEQALATLTGTIAQQGESWRLSTATTTGRHPRPPTGKVAHPPHRRASRRLGR